MAHDPNVIKTCIDAFIDFEGQFLDALIEVFPECSELKTCKLEFDMATKHAPENLREPKKRQLVEMWNQYMGKWTMACQQKNAALVMKNANFPPSIQKINFEQKWKEPLDDETRDCIWQYIGELQKYGQMYVLYTAVPTNMMSKIQTMAMSMAQDMQNGTMSPESMDIQSLSQKVSEQVSEQDIQHFANNMMGNMSTVSSLLGSMMPPNNQS